MTEPNQDPDPFPQFIQPYKEFPSGFTIPEGYKIPGLESDKEMIYRLAEEAKAADFERDQESKEAIFRRWREVFLTGGAAAVIGFSLWACFQVVNDQSASEDAKKAAVAAISSVLTSTVTGIGGYLAGSKSCKP
ncbi:MAG: hypothetical protein HC851_02210 [Acaryochloris sp. RU_4_1]|nr:hypothetical protein [Acaryochloris sp. RU_4_1]NJN39090.1 hypothetical protein [Acaryochloridaceae cyanobacterium CSU_3_4]NJR56419.1 hypothetical protein [Acaryochloris sp. CRU_2_0]